MPNLLTFKIVYIGDPGVGKTSLRRRFLGLSFNNQYDPTIGVDISIYNYDYKGVKIKFFLFDLAGQQRFENVRREFYKGANGAFVVFDVTNYMSFYNVFKWIKEYWKNTYHLNPFVLIGNKIDLKNRREVGIEVIYDYIKTFYEKVGYKIDYIETSAKTGENVREAFKKLLVKIVQKYKETMQKT